jgi:hypothetical protein
MRNIRQIKNQNQKRLQVYDYRRDGEGNGIKNTSPSLNLTIVPKSRGKVAKAI